MACCRSARSIGTEGTWLQAQLLSPACLRRVRHTSCVSTLQYIHLVDQVDTLQSIHSSRYNPVDTIDTHTDHHCHGPHDHHGHRPHNHHGHGPQDRRPHEHGPTQPWTAHDQTARPDCVPTRPQLSAIASICHRLNKTNQKGSINIKLNC